ncbi:MFS transporter [Streptomyces sp. MNU103]|uniref:MFS transporter n=1 Tax=Streptomyces sp. MNU103 TaxID=2560024 RepID=UPI001E5A1635|nr:MFS transporter [Streptomyces sp. MNU103]
MTAPNPRDTGVAEPAGAPAPAVVPDDTVLSRRYRALSIGVVSVVLLIAFEATAVGTAMPVAARELNGVSLYAFAFSGYFTTSLFGMVLSGQWSDRRGPLAPLTWGIASFAAGLLTSGAVTEHLGWRWVFLGIPVIVVLPLALALPQIRRLASGPVGGAAEAPASFDRRRIRLALAISFGAGLLQYAAQDLRWLSLLPGALGVALLVPAVLGLLPRGTWRAARGLPSVVLLRGVAAGSFIAAESFVPLMLVTQRGLSPTLAGFSLAAGGGTWALGSWVQSRPRLEKHRERLMTVGMLLVAFAIAAAPSVLIHSVPAWTLAVAWAFGCFGMGLVISSTSVLLLQLSAPEEAGTNSAALQISDGLSNVLLLAIGGAAFAALGGGTVSHAATEATGSHPAAFAAVFLPMAAVALAGVWIATRLRPEERP